MSSSGLFLAAPAGTAWPLDLDAFETRLRERYPDAVSQRYDSRVTNSHQILFDLVVNGTPRNGIYSDESVLVLSDGHPADWTETVKWFLTLLPPAAPLVAMTEANPVATPVPSGATAAQIQAMWESLNS